MNVRLACGRYIEVFMSSADEVRAYAARMDGGGAMGGGMRSARGPRPTPYERGGDRYGGGRPVRGGWGGGGGARGSWGGGGGGRGFRRGGGAGGGGGGGYCVHMRGLPFKATAQDIAYFFKPIRPVNINILFDNSGRPSGEADVDFECHEDALRVSIALAYDL